MLTYFQITQKICYHITLYILSTYKMYVKNYQELFMKYKYKINNSKHFIQTVLNYKMKYELQFKTYKFTIKEIEPKTRHFFWK